MGHCVYSCAIGGSGHLDHHVGGGKLNALSEHKLVNTGNSCISDILPMGS